MGKPTGFLEYGRCENSHRPIGERIKDFKELYVSQSEAVRKEQAARCMNCGVPFCQSAIELKGMVTGCPLHNLIPEWNDEIYHENIAYALNRLRKTNPFPEFTGRVCPALCEKACINGFDGEAVCVHDNEKFIIEKAFELGLMTPQVPKVCSGKRVAVVGSGPSGLALADMLNRRGHEVCVFEREDMPGGLLMYGIPNMKLDKKIIRRRIRLMKEEGVSFHTNMNVGEDISFEELKEHFDAVALCTGSKKARSIFEGDSGIEGVDYAVDFLSEITKRLMLDLPLPDLHGKKVIVVGGGDTGNDCTGTVLRKGCKSVTALEMMPKPPVERGADNPWPEWPKVLKTDYGQNEAIERFGKDPRLFQTTISEVYEDEGKIAAVKIVSLGPDRKPIEGSEKVLPCDLLLIAAGFVGVPADLSTSFDLPLTGRNTIAAENGGKHVDGKLFACGDCRRGQSLVVWGLMEGRTCAREVDESLMGYSNIE